MTVIHYYDWPSHILDRATRFHVTAQQEEDNKWVSTEQYHKVTKILQHDLNNPLSLLVGTVFSLLVTESDTGS